jgi:hypothetical protein
MTDKLEGHLPDCEPYSVCETCDCAEIKLKSRIAELEAALQEIASSDDMYEPASWAIHAARDAIKPKP